MHCSSIYLNSFHGSVFRERNRKFLTEAERLSQKGQSGTFRSTKHCKPQGRKCSVLLKKHRSSHSGYSGKYVVQLVSGTGRIEESLQTVFPLVGSE